MLPTAQAWVDAGKLPASALVLNGGTLDPSDRIVDTWSSSASIQTMLARGLGDDSHSIRITNTGYRNPLATDDRLSFVGNSGRTIWWGADGVSIADPGAEALLVQILQSTTSSAEMALGVRPAGGTSESYVGGRAHGYEDELAIEVTVDGSPVDLPDGAVVAGDEVGLATLENLHIRKRRGPAGDHDLQVRPCGGWSRSGSRDHLFPPAN